LRSFAFAHQRGAFTRAPNESAQQEDVMAQERKRGNREAKKPKAIKQAADPNPPVMALGRLTPIKPTKKSH
jgi:hypothetical protein